MAIKPIQPSMADYEAAGRLLGATYSGADLHHLAQQAAAKREIKEKARLLLDEKARQRLVEILDSSNALEIERVATLLTSKRIKDAIRAQRMTEESIRNIARTFDRPIAARRFLRKQVKQATSFLNLSLGLVGNDGHRHVTPHELNLRNQQKARWLKFGESVTLKRGDESVSMLTVMEAASEKKLAETYALTKGLESYAKAAGLTWAFITLTAPGRMHPNPSNGHSTWDGTTPDGAHEWIHDAYHRAELRLRKRGIIISGLRVTEPHKDACPHHHGLIFAHPDDMATIEAEFRKQPEWTGKGLEWRLNDGRASAATYCFKYITKTINSVEQLAGEHGSVDAWRSTWAIRAFQFFGMPPVGLWRNLRAVKECPAEPLMAGLWRAARRGDGHAFIGLAGGLNCKKSERPVVSKTISNGKTKTIEFILQDTAESIRFDIEKWKQTKAGESCKANKNTMVEVIPNDPRKAKTTNKTASGRAGFAPCTAIGGGQCLIRGTAPPPIPPPTFPVGR